MVHSTACSIHSGQVHFQFHLTDRFEIIFFSFAFPFHFTFVEISFAIVVAEFPAAAFFLLSFAVASRGNGGQWKALLRLIHFFPSFFNLSMIQQKSASVKPTLILRLMHFQDSKKFNAVSLKHFFCCASFHNLFFYLRSISFWWWFFEYSQSDGFHHHMFSYIINSNSLHRQSRAKDMREKNVHPETHIHFQ